MKPKTIIAMLGALALMVAFAGVSYAGDEDAKAARAAALRDCKANGTAMCQLELKATEPANFNMCCQLHADGFFVSRTDLKNVLEKYPGSVIATGQLLSDGSSKTMAVTKATLPDLNIKVNKAEVNASGALAEQAIEVNLVKEPISKLVVYDKSAIEDGVIIIHASELIEATLAAGGGCTDPDCCPVEDIEFLDPAGIEYAGSVWDYEAIQAFLETAIGALLDGFCIYDADGVCIDIDWAGIAALLDATEWGLVFDAMAEYLPSAEALTDIAVGESVVEMRECYYDENGVPKATIISDPAEAGASFRKTVAKKAATEIAGKQKPPELICTGYVCLDGLGGVVDCEALEATCWRYDPENCTGPYFKVIIDKPPCNEPPPVPCNSVTCACLLDGVLEPMLDCNDPCNGGVCYIASDPKGCDTGYPKCMIAIPK